MNVAELMERLAVYPRDAEVILAADPDGNGYWDLWDVDSMGQTEEEGLEDDWGTNTPFGVYLWPGSRI